MKKRNKKGFFLSETMVVIAVVAVVLLVVFKTFSSVYYGFRESENYNTANAINALSNIQKYYESIGEIDTNGLSLTTTYINLTNDEKYESDYYTRIKEEYNITDVYLMDLNLIYTDSNFDNIYALLRRYINTLKNVQGTVMVVAINENEFAYVKIKDFRNLTLVGDKEDEYAVYIPIGGTFTDPGYTGWNGENPYIEWENEKVVDTSKPGTYYLHYDFEGYLFRRKVVVGGMNGVDYINHLYNTFATNNGLIKDDTIDENIRYAGSSSEVKNYVQFNGELWRIIGVFDVKKDASSEVEKRIKLVRVEPLIRAVWDSSEGTYRPCTGINCGLGTNVWSDADIQNMLNTYYIGESNTCTYCDEFGQGVCPNDCTSIVTPLSSVSLNMIDDAAWNTGILEYYDNLVTSPKKAYSAEITNQSEVSKVGLISVSDYGYAGKLCTNVSDTTCGSSDNWMNFNTEYWTITRRQDNIDVWGVYKSQCYNGKSSITDGKENPAVYPSVYLKSNIEIISGEGTIINPYNLRLK